MKPTRSVTSSENKLNEFSVAEISRVKLPRLQKPIKKVKKVVLKGSSRMDTTPSKYDQLVEEIIELQSCVTKKYGKAIKVESLRKMQNSITSLNRELSIGKKMTCIQTAKEPAIRSTSSSDADDKAIPATKEVSKWSKRLCFQRRLEMANQNLVILNFEGVVGGIFKDNIWQDQEEKLHIRKGTIKGLHQLLETFQVVLFFHSPRENYEKALSYFRGKGIKFDGVYASENTTQFLEKNSWKFKKSLKYSENVQNYSQISVDFGLQNEMLGRILIVTSIWLDPEETFTAGMNLVVKNFNGIPQYLW